LGADRASIGCHRATNTGSTSTTPTSFTPCSRTDECVDRGISPAKCDEVTRWLQSVALAFLDAHVREDAFARRWLQSDNISIASRGVAEWSRK
jgi:hypothetical protein